MKSASSPRRSPTSRKIRSPQGEIRWLAQWERRARRLSQSAANAQDKFAALEGDVESRIEKILGARSRLRALLGC